VHEIHSPHLTRYVNLTADIGPVILHVGIYDNVCNILINK